MENKPQRNTKKIEIQKKTNPEEQANRPVTQKFQQQPNTRRITKAIEMPNTKRITKSIEIQKRPTMEGSQSPNRVTTKSIEVQKRPTTTEGSSQSPNRVTTKSIELQKRPTTDGYPKSDRSTTKYTEAQKGPSPQSILDIDEHNANTVRAYPEQYNMESQDTIASKHVQVISIANSDPELVQFLQMPPENLPVVQDIVIENDKVKLYQGLQQVPLADEDQELVRLLQMGADELPIIPYYQNPQDSPPRRYEGLQTVPVVHELPELVEALERLEYVSLNQYNPNISANIEQQEQASDIEILANQLGIPIEDLTQAMTEENIATIEELQQTFNEFSHEPAMQGQNFATFVHCMVSSYIDRKNEDELLSLIGVSSSTGRQQLDSTYSQLLQQIFQAKIGGFFLRDTVNENYNAFNLGNLIQEKLVALKENQRISYLERLIYLLSQRELLLERSKKIVQRFLALPDSKNIYPAMDEVIPALEKYLCDLALYRLCFRPTDQLPGDVSALVPVDVYQCLEFLWGLPPYLSDKKNRLIYMLQKLHENDPLYFHV